MAKISIVYHSVGGRTAALAEAAARGARSIPGVEAVLIPVEVASSRLAELNSSDAILFGTPTYMGTVSGAMKTFMDGTSKLWYQGLWRDKVAGAFTNSASLSGDKLNTLITLAVFAMQHGMIWIGPGVAPGDPRRADDPSNLNRLGSSLGVMAQSDHQGDPLITPPVSDRNTVETLGRRVALLTTQLERGRAFRQAA